jgi:hypothetical protein
MEELRAWIRAAEAARATCLNVTEFDKLIGHQKKRLEEQMGLPTEPGSPVHARAGTARKPDEDGDIKLIQELIFQTRDIALEPFSKEEMVKGKTPDFKLVKGSTLCGYCELKSPRDDWVFGPPDGLKHGQSISVTRRSPTSNNLARQIMSAVEQFDAINPEHKLPNVLVLVNHAVGRTRSDLYVTLTGIPVPGGQPLFTLKLNHQMQVWEAARRVDLFLWVDAQKRSWQPLYANDAIHRATVCELLGVP